MFSPLSPSTSLSMQVITQYTIVISGNVRGAICNKSIRVSQQSQWLAPEGPALS